MQVRFGIDLGGSKIEILALDTEGSVLLRQRVVTPQGDYPAILDTIAKLVAESEKKLGATGTVGIGTPGVLSRASGCLKNSNSTCLNGQPLLQNFETRLGRSVRMSNDANCFALSEASDGAAVGARVVFGVIIGTGTGAGIVVDGKILEGPNGISGEWGHNPLPWPQMNELPGPDCYCGQQGCIETFLSGPGMLADHQRYKGKAMSSEAIVAGAEAGDPNCSESLLRYESRLARGLAHVINILDPDVIVLGGGMSNIDRLYQSIPKLWGDYIFSDRVDTRLVKHIHGDSSGVRGAAWLWSPDV